MTDDDLSRLLSDAFDAQARSAVGDHAAAPPPRYAAGGTGTGRDPEVVDTVRPEPGPHHRRWVRVTAPLVAAAAVLAVVLTVAFVSLGSDGHHRRSTAVADGRVPGSAGTRTDVTTAGATSASSSPSSSSSSVGGAPVHVKLLNSDGSDYGVGMPVIAYFSRRITNGKTLQDATTVTVDGRPAHGAWYFEASRASRNYPVEGHFRLQDYWPANAKVHVGIAARGLSAGAGLAYDNDLTLDFRTHDRVVSTVRDSTHTLTVTDNGKTWGTFPVSLGAAATPTSRGTKVIMEKGSSICMRGPGYSECGIKDTQRLTYSGEYLHAAPWNVAHITQGVDSSNGCTNLLPKDAARLFGFLGVGDVLDYPDANGPVMTLGQGYGDWDVPWSQWRTGGLVPTT